MFELYRLATGVSIMGRGGSLQIGVSLPRSASHDIVFPLVHHVEVAKVRLGLVTRDESTHHSKVFRFGSGRFCNLFPEFRLMHEQFGQPRRIID